MEEFIDTYLPRLHSKQETFFSKYNATKFLKLLYTKISIFPIKIVKEELINNTKFSFIYFQTIEKDYLQDIIILEISEYDDNGENIFLNPGVSVMYYAKDSELESEEENAEIINFLTKYDIKIPEKAPILSEDIIVNFSSRDKPRHAYNFIGQLECHGLAFVCVEHKESMSKLFNKLPIWTLMSSLITTNTHI